MSHMDMGMSNSTSSMIMATYFNTSLGGANLWFDSWTPTTPAATAGAAIALFLLAILARALTAIRSSAERAFAQSLALKAARPIAGKDGADSLPPRYLQAPPFILAIDLPRSLLLLVQSAVGYLLMLSVMTFNVYFFISVLGGLTVGELAFGRYSAGHGHDTGLHI